MGARRIVGLLVVVAVTVGFVLSLGGFAGRPSVSRAAAIRGSATGTNRPSRATTGSAATNRAALNAVLAQLQGHLPLHSVRFLAPLPGLVGAQAVSRPRPRVVPRLGPDADGRICPIGAQTASTASCPSTRAIPNAGFIADSLMAQTASPR